MNILYRQRQAIHAAIVLAAAFGASSIPQPAAAQSFFDALFGGTPRYSRPEPLPPQTSSYADPFDLGREPRRYSSGGYGGGTAYCVRTCDGRYFPLQRHAGVSPAELCKSFCPASKTMVFSGSKIDYAVAPNGVRYADLDNAFAYRDKVVENCSCNGKDGLGLARLSPVTDPTLRPGDIVATNDGLVNFRGRNSKTAEFTPIDFSSSAWAQRLSDIKIRPAPPEEPVQTASTDEEPKRARNDRRRVQLAR